ATEDERYGEREIEGGKGEGQLSFLVRCRILRLRQIDVERKPGHAAADDGQRLARPEHKEGPEAMRGRDVGHDSALPRRSPLSACGWSCLRNVLPDAPQDSRRVDDHEVAQSPGPV